MSETLEIITTNHPSYLQIIDEMNGRTLEIHELGETNVVEIVERIENETSIDILFPVPSPNSIVPQTQDYLHVQSSSDSTWIINHNLGFYPNIATFNTGGQEIEGSILHTSLNQARVNFEIAISGKARCS